MRNHSSGAFLANKIVLPSSCYSGHELQYRMSSIFTIITKFITNIISLSALVHRYEGLMNPDASAFRQALQVHGLMCEAAPQLPGSRQVGGGAQMPPPQRLLDLGCGTSRLGEQLAQLGHSVAAVDSSEAAIRLCRSRQSALAALCSPQVGVDADQGSAAAGVGADAGAAEAQERNPLPAMGGAVVFELGDATRLRFRDAEFGAVLDKATLDSLDCLGPQMTQAPTRPAQKARGPRSAPLSPSPFRPPCPCDLSPAHCLRSRCSD